MYRVAWGDNPLVYAPLPILETHPGRWDDLKFRFRTGCYGDSLVTCLIEVLAGLRPDPVTLGILRAMGEPFPDLNVAIQQALSPKYASVVISEEDRVVDIVHARSRTEFELRTRRRKKLKSGDFLAADLSVSRRAAGVVYDAGYCGVCAPSAEALAIDAKSAAMTYNVFETKIGSNQARAMLVAHTVRPALQQTIDIASARDFLGI